MQTCSAQEFKHYFDIMIEEAFYSKSARKFSIEQIAITYIYVIGTGYFMSSQMNMF